MNSITFPLKLQMKGSAVADLQDALFQLLERSAILGGDGRARLELAAVLRRESEAEIFGEATQKLVSIFQEERHLEVVGAVDAATANALHALLREAGLLDEELGGDEWLVTGRVTNSRKEPVPGLLVAAFDQDLGSNSPWTVHYERTLMDATASV